MVVMVHLHQSHQEVLEVEQEEHHQQVLVLMVLHLEVMVELVTIILFQVHLLDKLEVVEVEVIDNMVVEVEVEDIEHLHLMQLQHKHILS